MTCKELAEVYELYALGVLDGPERESLEEHLGRNCEICMKEIKRAAANNALVFGAAPSLDPRAGLRSRILAGFGLETRPLWVRVMPWAVACAAVALLLFIGTGPRGRLLVQQDKGIMLMVVNLPALPAGKMYETWIVPRTGAPKPAGQLYPGKNGDAVARIRGPLDSANVQAVAVSVEPAGSQPVTPTQVLFAAPFNGI
jgi:anti-sigma-K factor RskA